jgi:hypothetical protein
VIEELDHGVVGDEEVDVAVAIIVGESDSQAFSGFRETDLLRDLGEMTIAIVVIDERGDGLEHVRMAIRTVTLFVFATPDVIEIPLNVAKNNEIEKAVIV